MMKMTATARVEYVMALLNAKLINSEQVIYLLDSNLIFHEGEWKAKENAFYEELLDLE